MTQTSKKQKNLISYLLVLIWIITSIIIKSLSIKLAVLLFLISVSFYFSLLYIKSLESKEKIKYITYKMGLILIVLSLSYIYQLKS